jgi:hypothetical protein
MKFAVWVTWAVRPVLWKEVAPGGNKVYHVRHRIATKLEANRNADSAPQVGMSGNVKALESNVSTNVDVFVLRNPAVTIIDVDMPQNSVCGLCIDPEHDGTHAQLVVIDNDGRWDCKVDPSSFVLVAIEVHEHTSAYNTIERTWVFYL